MDTLVKYQMKNINFIEKTMNKLFRFVLFHFVWFTWHCEVIWFKSPQIDKQLSIEFCEFEIKENL